MRKANYDWNCGEANSTSYEQARLAVLMDIRDRMQSLLNIFNCPNFQRIPRVLNDIKRNTNKPKRKKVQK